jgi:uncharacterized protein YhfF
MNDEDFEKSLGEYADALYDEIIAGERSASSAKYAYERRKAEG